MMACLRSFCSDKMNFMQFGGPEKNPVDLNDPGSDLDLREIYTEDKDDNSRLMYHVA